MAPIQLLFMPMISAGHKKRSEDQTVATKSIDKQENRTRQEEQEELHVVAKNEIKNNINTDEEKEE